MRFTSIAIGTALLLTAISASAQETDEAVNNGTNPTLLSNTVQVQYKYLSILPSGSTDLFELTYSTPFGATKNMSLGFNLPYASGYSDDSFGFGDASIKFTHVPFVNQSHGFAYTAEIFFDTASRDELGYGLTVLKASAYYAKFLKNGAIIAPALVQVNNLQNSGSRNPVNNTTFDLYYVPKLANPNYYITFDPAITADWENDRTFGSLTITFGRMLGKVFGGDSQVYIKPQVLAGGERPSDWSFQVGYKILGF